MTETEKSVDVQAENLIDVLTDSSPAIGPSARAPRQRGRLLSKVNTADPGRGRRYRDQPPAPTVGAEDGGAGDGEVNQCLPADAPGRPTHSDPGPRSILARRGLLATDVVDYGRRTAIDQDEIQRTYQDAIQHAAGAAGLDVRDWLRQMAGDGELAILPDGVHEPDVLATMLPVLAGWLRRHNRPRRTEHHLRIRVALHNGLIHVNGAAGFPGRSTVLVMRLLASTMLRDAMDSRPDVSVAAMISKRLYQEIVLNGYLGLRPEDFHRAAAEVPAKDFKATAWLYFPEDAASVHG